MTPIFEELDYQVTSLGAISLRRRTEPRCNNRLIYEVKLGDEFLMSSLFTESEIQLGKLGVEASKAQFKQEKLNIIVGGLGLGYTAAAVLEDAAVNALSVIDIMQPVISWHENELVPLGNTLHSDPRCQFIHADFFELASMASHSMIAAEEKHHDRADVSLQCLLGAAHERYLLDPRVGVDPCWLAFARFFGKE
jgi:hypothetical protein